MSTEQYTIEVKSVDWIVIMSNLVKTYDVEQTGTNIVIDPSGAYTTFFIDKTLVPADVLAKVIGATPEAVSNATSKIVLLPLKGQKNWQEPTVNYYGMA
jgi:hypothetical protein